MDECLGFMFVLVFVNMFFRDSCFSVEVNMLNHVLIHSCVYYRDVQLCVVGLWYHPIGINNW